MLFYHKCMYIRNVVTTNNDICLVNLIDYSENFKKSILQKYFTNIFNTYPAIDNRSISFVIQFLLK